MFERAHHQRIGRVLQSLDPDLLRDRQCWFGGGTAIALSHGEYRESVVIDFLVSDAIGYRRLRQSLRGATDLASLTRPGHDPFPLQREVRADQYGIRTFVVVDTVPIKFEIVHEGRVAFDMPGRHDQVCGVARLSPHDLATSKLLANSDRWRDQSVFARDAIDLAMLDLPPRQLAPALRKAMAAYGPDVVADLNLALAALRARPQWLARCTQALAITLPPAAVLQRLRLLARRLATASGALA